MHNSTKHHLLIGRDYYNAGEYARARPHLEAVLRTHDDFADVHNMLGVIAYEDGRQQMARASFERALAINPHYTEAALNLAIVYNELGRYDDARRIYSQAQGERRGEGLDSLNHFVRGKIANMHAELGDAYVAAGLLQHAIREYRKALNVSPTFVDIRTKLAVTLRDGGQLEEALDEFIGIRESAPEHLQARVHLGVTLWRAGLVEEARREWQHVLGQDPENRSCRVYLRMTRDEPPAGAAAEEAGPTPEDDPDFF